MSSSLNARTVSPDLSSLELSSTMMARALMMTQALETNRQMNKAYQSPLPDRPANPPSPMTLNPQIPTMLNPPYLMMSTPCDAQSERCNPQWLVLCCEASKLSQKRTGPS